MVIGSYILASNEEKFSKALHYRYAYLLFDVKFLKFLRTEIEPLLFIIVVVYGASCLGVAFLAESLGGLLQVRIKTSCIVIFLMLT